MRKNDVYPAPTDAVVAVTYKCNSKCIMCNIWKENPVDELDPRDFSKLPNTLKDINITGGEPFLRNDLVDVIGEITNINPGSRIVISSNGFMTDKIIDTMQKIIKVNKNSCIALSLDGIQEVHDRIRGINKAYDKVISTIDGLKKSGINDVRIGFTSSKENIDHLAKVYDLSRSLGIEFTLNIVHNSDGYFNIESNQAPDAKDLDNQLNRIIPKECKFSSLRRLFRVYYMRRISDYLKTKKRPLVCRALKDFFFMDSKGNIYPCNIFTTSIGNIKEDDFRSIWMSNKTEKLRNFCKNCDNCWMVCTVKSSIRREFIKVTKEVGKEIVSNKFKTLIK